MKWGRDRAGGGVEGAATCFCVSLAPSTPSLHAYYLLGGGGEGVYTMCFRHFQNTFRLPLNFFLCWFNNAKVSWKFQVYLHLTFQKEKILFLVFFYSSVFLLLKGFSNFVKKFYYLLSAFLTINCYRYSCYLATIIFLKTKRYFSFRT